MKAAIFIFVVLFGATLTMGNTVAYADNSNGTVSSGPPPAGTGPGATTSGPPGVTQPPNPGEPGTPPSTTPTQVPSKNITETPHVGGNNTSPKYSICNGHKVPLSAGICPLPVVVPPGHTQDFGTGYTYGVKDGGVGVYDPAPACAGKTGSALEHCIIGYNDAYVTYCQKSQSGCGDGPTTCPPGESTKDCSVPPTAPPPKCVISYTGSNGCRKPQPCQHPTIGLFPVNCPLPPPIKCPAGSHLDDGKCAPCKFINGINGSIICHYHPPPTKIVVVKSYVGSSKSGGLRQIPSNVTDFPGNNPNTVQVHVIGAKKDIVGAYHVTGEITNTGNQTLNSVQVTAHLYDTSGNLVGDTIGYTSPANIDPGHTATFDSLATSDQINGNPVSFRLSFDWS